MQISDSDRLAVVLFCVAGVMALVLYLVEKSPLSICVTLSLMVIFLIYPILHMVRGTIRRVLCFGVCIIGTAGLGFEVWPTDHRPDISVRMVYPGDVGVQLVNVTDVDADQVRCALRVWDLDAQSGDGLLPLTEISTGWMNRHSQTSEHLSDVKDNIKAMKAGDRLFGIVGVACKGCKTERDILFYVSPREGVAWYAPWTRSDFPDWTNLGIASDLPGLKKNPTPYLNNWAPAKSRKEITNSLSRGIE
jgi:hypothetical protein